MRRRGCRGGSASPRDPLGVIIGRSRERASDSLRNQRLAHLRCRKGVRDDSCELYRLSSAEDIALDIRRMWFTARITLHTPSALYRQSARNVRHTIYAYLCEGPAGTPTIRNPTYVSASRDTETYMRLLLHYIRPEGVDSKRTKSHRVA